MTDLEFNTAKACLIIRNYLRSNDIDVDIQTKYAIAVQQIITDSTNLEKIKMVGVTQQTQGARSTTFNAKVEPWTITEDIKLLLPKPIHFHVW